MSRSVEAIFERGVFRPLEPVDLPDQTRVTISLSEPSAARFVSDPRPTDAEFDRLLQELASGSAVPTLPADFSRADIYDDHD